MVLRPREDIPDRWEEPMALVVVEDRRRRRSNRSVVDSTSPLGPFFGVNAVLFDRSRDALGSFGIDFSRLRTT